MLKLLTLRVDTGEMKVERACLGEAESLVFEAGNPLQYNERYIDCPFCGWHVVSRLVANLSNLRGDVLRWRMAILACLPTHRDTGTATTIC